MDSFHIIGMAKQMPTPGRCFVCRQELTKRTSSTHVKKTHQDPDGVPRLLILVDTPSSSPYWLLLGVNPSGSLQDIDNVLRRVWLECCGHLSLFDFDGEEIEMRWEDDPALTGKSGASNKRFSVQKNIAPGQSFSYIYDYGSTTELRLKAGDLIQMKDTGEMVSVLAMNDPPAWTCSECGKPAVCHYNENDDGTVLCEECSEDPDLDDCYLLPITNSPRTGICAYEGGWYDEDT